MQKQPINIIRYSEPCSIVEFEHFFFFLMFIDAVFLKLPIATAFSRTQHTPNCFSLDVVLTIQRLQTQACKACEVSGMEPQ